MCTRTLLLLACVLACAPASAQNVMSAGGARGAVVPWFNCAGEYPGNPFIWTKRPKDRVAWCQEEAAAATFDYTLRISALDNATETKVVPPLVETPIVGVQCYTSAGGMHCTAPVPESAYSALEGQGTTTLVLELVAAAGGVASPSAGLVAQAPSSLRSCNYTAPGSTTAETRPVDYAIGGNISASGGKSALQAAAERVGQLRRDGWRVEWQFNPAANNVAVMMWCVGVPQ